MYAWWQWARGRSPWRVGRFRRRGVEMALPWNGHVRQKFYSISQDKELAIGKIY